MAGRRLTDDRRRLAERHVDLVPTVAWKLKRLIGPRADLDELIGDGMVGLVEAARDYDPNRCDRFEPWALICIRYGMMDGLRSRIGRGARPQMASLETLGDAVIDAKANVAEIVELRDRLVEFALQRPPCVLTPPELEAIVGAARGETSVETAERLGKATETVREQRKKAIKKLGARNIAQAAFIVGAFSEAEERAVRST